MFSDCFSISDCPEVSGGVPAPFSVEIEAKAGKWLKEGLMMGSNKNI